MSDDKDKKLITTDQGFLLIFLVFWTEGLGAMGTIYLTLPLCFDSENVFESTMVGIVLIVLAIIPLIIFRKELKEIP